MPAPNHFWRYVLVTRAVGKFLDRLAFGSPAARKMATENSELRARLAELQSGVGQTLQVMPGTPYSRYALPVEYQPSRDFRPRWVTSRPIGSINAWFSANTDRYLEFVKRMRASGDKLKRVPLEFDPENLPSPAWAGVPYCSFDAVALYTMVQYYKPKRYLEIGSGITTCWANLAIKDAGLGTKIISIDPEPRARIDAICDEIIRDGLETCDLTLFDQLEAGDILFFDGSHRSFMNSDVTVFFIDVLPRIKPGVVIHIHDIMLPYDYPESFKHWYWNEQYLLAVYLMGNRERINPLLPTAFICKDARFEQIFSPPIVDVPVDPLDWRGGGAMWFTHLAP